MSQTLVEHLKGEGDDSLKWIGSSRDEEDEDEFYRRLEVWLEEIGRDGWRHFKGEPGGHLTVDQINIGDSEEAVKLAPDTTASVIRGIIGKSYKWSRGAMSSVRMEDWPIGEKSDEHLPLDEDEGQHSDEEKVEKHNLDEVMAMGCALENLGVRIITMR